MLSKAEKFAKSPIKKEEEIKQEEEEMESDYSEMSDSDVSGEELEIKGIEKQNKYFVHYTTKFNQIFLSKTNFLKKKKKKTPIQCPHKIRNASQTPPWKKAVLYF